MHEKDLDINIVQEIVLDEAQDLGSLEEDDSDSNTKEAPSITEIEYPDLEDVEADL